MRESTIFQRLSAEGRGGLLSFIRFSTNYFFFLAGIGSRIRPLWPTYRQSQQRLAYGCHFALCGSYPRAYFSSVQARRICPDRWPLSGYRFAWEHRREGCAHSPLPGSGGSRKGTRFRFVGYFQVLPYWLCAPAATLFIQR